MKGDEIMPTIRLPHIAEGSIDVAGTRVPVKDHLVTVPIDHVGLILRAQPGAELVPEAAGKEQ